MGRYSVRGTAAATVFVVLAGLVVVAPTAARAGDPPKGGGNASPRTAFTPVSQSTSGSGSTSDLDLPAMGATPDHKDVFVEVDWMVHRACIFSLCVTLRSFAPNQQALTDVRNAFALSPVQNPDGTTGIRMHIDSGPNSLMNPTTGAQWGTATTPTSPPVHSIASR